MIPSEKIKQFREEYKLTQAQLAQKLEIPLKTLQDWEQGRFEPPEYLFRALNDIARELNGKANI